MGKFEDCVNALDGGGYDGIGFEFNNNGIVGIDLDHVIAENGSLSDEAVGIVAMLDSYTEYSPSGKGLHIFVKGDIPVDGRKKGFIEMYKAKRYFFKKSLSFSTTYLLSCSKVPFYY